MRTSVKGQQLYFIGLMRSFFRGWPKRDLQHQTVYPVSFPSLIYGYFTKATRKRLEIQFCTTQRGNKEFYMVN